MNQNISEYADYYVCINMFFDFIKLITSDVRQYSVY